MCVCVYCVPSIRLPYKYIIIHTSCVITDIRQRLVVQTPTHHVEAIFTHLAHAIYNSWPDGLQSDVVWYSICQINIRQWPKYTDRHTHGTHSMDDVGFRYKSAIALSESKWLYIIIIITIIYWGDIVCKWSSSSAAWRQAQFSMTLVYSVCFPFFWLLCLLHCSCCACACVCILREWLRGTNGNICRMHDNRSSNTQTYRGAHT